MTRCVDIIGGIAGTVIMVLWTATAFAIAIIVPVYILYALFTFLREMFI
jgi:hypothetical protein